MTNGEKYRTANEREEGFREFCIFYNGGTGCRKCSIVNLTGKKQSMIECAFIWLDLECEEEKPLPCPFCGGGCWVSEKKESDGRFRVRCKSFDCNYVGQANMYRADAILAHNRVARAVMEAEKKGSAEC